MILAKDLNFCLLEINFTNSQTSISPPLISRLVNHFKTAEDAVEEAIVEVSQEEKFVQEMDGAQKPLEPDLPLEELSPDLPLHHHFPIKPQTKERPQWSQVEQLRLLP
jgi:hypothetical protein